MMRLQKSDATNDYEIFIYYYQHCQRNTDTALKPKRGKPLRASQLEALFSHMKKSINLKTRLIMRLIRTTVLLDFRMDSNHRPESILLRLLRRALPTELLKSILR